MLNLTIILIALFILIIASYSDLKILEVPDWLNYSGIAAGLGIHIIFSLQQASHKPILSSVLGLAIAFGIGALMFYSGQWGGADAKLLMALGALIGFEADKFSFGASFLINLVFIGAIWGILWISILAIKHSKKFWRTFRALRIHKSFFRLRISSTVIALILVVSSFFQPLFQTELLGIALLTFFVCYLIIAIKAVELSGMYHWISPSKLTEGDWLVHAVKVGKNKVIPSRLGLEKAQLKTLQKLHKEKKLKRVLVRYGVPFIPAFLFSFIVTLVWNNFLLTLLF